MSPSSPTPSPIANRKIPETFTLRRATRYGGFNLLSDFVRAQGIDRALAEAFGQAKASWATYSLAKSLRHLLDGYLLGLERIWRFEELEQEPLPASSRPFTSTVARSSPGPWPYSGPTGSPGPRGSVACPAAGQHRMNLTRTRSIEPSVLQGQRCLSRLHSRR